MLKKFSLLLPAIITITQLFFPSSNFSQVINFGSVANFVLFTSDGALGNTGVSQITGNIGTNVGAFTGFGGSTNVNGAIHNVDAVSAQCVLDLEAAYDQLNNITPTNTIHAPAFGSGETLFAGVYYIGGAGSVAGTLTLDAQGNPDAVFIFKIGGAFTTGAYATVVLANGASPCNVFWVAEGEIAMATFTIMKGTLIAHPGAVSMGYGCNLEGRMFSTTGAASVYEVDAFISCSIITSWTGAAGTSNWFTAGNWDGGVPDEGTLQAFIPTTLQSGRVFPIIDTGIAVIDTLTIKNSASLGVSNAALVIKGAVINNGTFDASDGNIEMAGSVAQIIAANTFTTNTIKNLIVSNDVTLAGPNNITGTLSFGDINNTLSTNGFLTLKSSADATARVAEITLGNTVSGNVNIERYIPANRAWRLLTSPTDASGAQTIHDAWQEGVNNTTLNYSGNQNPVPGYGTHITKGNSSASGFDVGKNNNPSIQGYNAATGAWDALSSTNIPITDYPAYMLFVRGNRSTNLSQGVNAPATNTILRSTGELKSGDQSYSVAATGFTVISNPFASAMDLEQVAKVNSTNIQDNFYVWDPKITGSNGVGGFVTISWDAVFSIYTITPFTGDGISQYIQSGAGFLARSANGTSPGTLVVKETDKTAAGSDDVNRPQNMSGAQKLVTNLYSVNTDGTTSVVDGVLNSYSTGYSNAVDNNDAVKLGNFSESISTLRNGQQLTVERRQPVTVADTIFFNMLQMKLKQYSFDFVAENLDLPGLTAVLEDSYLNTSTPVDLNATTTVSFKITNVAGAWAPNRFRIVFRPAAPLPVTLNSVKAWQQNDAIQVEWKVENEAGIKQYEVERSADGLHFIKSTIVIATINNHGMYNWLDLSAQEGNNYYRIKTIDVNGTVHYSSVVKVYIGKGGEQIVLDTKVITNGAIEFKLINMPAGKYGIRLLNNLGQIMYTKEIAHVGGSSRETLDLNTHLVNGIHMLEFTKPDSKKLIEKVIVE